MLHSPPGITDRTRHASFPQTVKTAPTYPLPRARGIGWGGGGPHQSALAPWIDQTVGTVATPANCVTCVPFMNQIATSPLVSCQRMSLLPSPSKSPVSTIVQAVGTVARPAD